MIMRVGHPALGQMSHEDSSWLFWGQCGLGSLHFIYNWFLIWLWGLILISKGEEPGDTGKMAKR